MTDQNADLHRSDQLKGDHQSGLNSVPVVDRRGRVSLHSKTDFSSIKDRWTDRDLAPNQSGQIVSWGTALVVPTLNAESWLSSWLKGLQAQSVLPEQIIIVDSESTDRTVSIAEAAGFEVVTIKRSDFSHGGTRQAIVDRLSGATVVLFLTQDAVLSRRNSLERLIAQFDDQRVGAAYGRQLPRPGARPIEAHARLFNYPNQSHVRSIDDIPTMGIKTSFISNSFAAWRREALMQVGGFPAHTIQCEDAWVASKMIKAGWKVAYCAEATVDHSHKLSMVDEFKRYFDTGVFYAQAQWIGEQFGSASGEGLKFVKSELKHLAQTEPTLIGSAIVRTTLKLMAYKLGCNENILPFWLKEKLSSNRGYWHHKDNRRGINHE